MKRFIICFFNCFLMFSQDYPKDYFAPPLDIPLDVSGSFGELRSNHFHSGLDLKTQGNEGLPVYASADGFVSRIKISTWGYGKAIYVTHPNGYTTVYAHLQKGNGKIEAYINQQHYKEQEYEIELFLKPSELPVTQGEVIAFSGNSGGSGGPHLHFEFRDTQSENILNPLLFGFDKYVIDKRKPKINGIKVYPINDSIAINDSFDAQNIAISADAEENYKATKIYTNGAIGFGINTFDNMTNAYNKNGIYKISTFVNGVPYFSYQFDSFSFNESRYINYFIDYFQYKNMGQRLQKLFIKNKYPLSIVESNPRNGILKTQPLASYNYKIVVEDFSKNATIIEIPVVYKQNTSENPLDTITTRKTIKTSKEYFFKEGNWSIYFPEHLFYEDFKMKMTSKDGILYLHEDEIPVKGYYTISYDVSSLSQNEIDKSFIASVDDNRVYYNTSNIKGQTISARIKKLGTYKLVMDEEAPRIYAPNFSEEKDLDDKKIISIKITDDLSGIDSYKAYLNDQWILMEYDYKTKRLVHNLSDNIYVKGKNKFKLVVKDKMNNSTTFESNFYKNN